KPDHVNPFLETDTASGDIEAALASADVTIDHTYTTPAEHNNPLEPHATIARWSSEGVTLYDSNQSSHRIRDIVAQVFGLEPERVRVISPYVGGAFGSKRSEEHTSELQSRVDLVCRLLLEKKNKQ